MSVLSRQTPGVRAQHSVLGLEGGNVHYSLCDDPLFCSHHGGVGPGVCVCVCVCVCWGSEGEVATEKARQLRRRMSRECGSPVLSYTRKPRTCQSSHSQLPAISAIITAEDLHAWAIRNQLESTVFSTADCV